MVGHTWPRSIPGNDGERTSYSSVSGAKLCVQIEQKVPNRLNTTVGFLVAAFSNLDAVLKFIEANRCRV